MKIINLGRSGVESSVIGLGCMGMSEFYGAHDDVQSLDTLERAFEIGVKLYDTSDVYGRGHNEELLGRFSKGKRDKVTLTSKFGVVRDPDGEEGSVHDRGVDNSVAYMRRCVEASLKRLNTDVIDVFYLHRADPRVPIEDTVGAMAELVREGKIRGIGVSEVDADTLRRGHAIHPIAALQSEYSLWNREPELDVLPVCKELDIAFVAYSPLGRGLFTGRLDTVNYDATNDIRLTSPRFSAENFEKNQRLVNSIQQFADRFGCAPGQVALAWMINRGQDIIPIPGTKRIKYLEENVGAASIPISAEDIADLDAAFPIGVAAGDRYEASFGTSWKEES